MSEKVQVGGVHKDLPQSHQHPPPPFKPLPFLEQRRRLAAALATVYDYREGYPSMMPCCNEDQFFDFDGGLRLIVTLEQEADADAVNGYLFHVSAGAYEDSALWRMVAKGTVRPAEFKDMVAAKVFKLWELDIRQTFVLWNPKTNTPHWRGRLNDAERIQLIGKAA